MYTTHIPYTAHLKHLSERRSIYATAATAGDDRGIVVDGLCRAYGARATEFLLETVGEGAGNGRLGYVSYYCARTFVSR